MFPGGAGDAADLLGGSRPLRIFIVENHDDTRFLLGLLLEQLGHVVFSAATKAEALAAIPAAHCDMLISDIGLPGMDGRQLADAARVLRPQLRVLLMSGYASAAVSAGGFLGPGMALVTKPFTIDILATRIGQMMAPLLPQAAASARIM